MNSRTRKIELTRRSLPFGGDVSLVRPPLYVRLALLAFAVTAAVVAGWMVSLRLMSLPFEPFSDYEEILPRQPWTAEITIRFYCGPQRGAGQYDYCTTGPAKGPFSLVGVTLENGIVNRVDFIVAEDRLTAGDLANRWGRPLVHLYGTSANFEWPEMGVTARGWAANGKFSYFIPMHHVSLAKPAS